MFLLYLWGIETLNNEELTLDKPQSFYFTYEELKQSKTRFISGFKNCFYFTYEELKHNILDPNTEPTKSFYFTYEELKLWFRWS